MRKLLFLLTFAFFSADAQNTVSVNDSAGAVAIRNGMVCLRLSLRTGLFSLSNNVNEKIIDNAFFQAGALQSTSPCKERIWSSEDVSDSIGAGKSLNIRVSFDDYADILWQARVYDNRPFVVFNMGIVNDVDRPYRLMSFSPLLSNSVFQGKDIARNYLVLDGNSGGSPTHVTDTAALTSFNNALVKFGGAGDTHILAAGGITYHEFEKFVKIARSEKSLQLALYSEDPVGRMIDGNSTYWLNEQFYLNFEDRDPFNALEQYAQVLKRAQHIDLHYYTFPTECLWYASFYSRDSSRAKFNNSAGAVEEMDNAVSSGIANYAKMAIRLVPDAYGPNNQQGWWDDEHWGMYGDAMSTDTPNYIKPYLTTRSWAKAIEEKGGLPFTYMQSDRRSEDFVKLHPGWMLFNDPYRPYTGIQRLLQESTYYNQFGIDYSGHWWAGTTAARRWGYDFTDTGFIKHMDTVYTSLKQAGIKGIFYDYPENTAWAYEGGFENKHATTAWAYRQMFQIPVDIMGKDVMLQERNIVRGSDIALGLISSQRVWADNDVITPEMIGRCGLRWYKNRTVINYDMDAKNSERALPKGNPDGWRAMYTMCYVTSGRFLLGRSTRQLSGGQLHDLTRTLPYPAAPGNARPLDAFNKGVVYPRVYDYKVNDDWHQLTFYNDDVTKPQTISVPLDKGLNEGGMGLSSGEQYFVYDFWNDRSTGLFDGKDELSQTLRPGEARMMSVHKKEGHPQLISTSRHIMQGLLDINSLRWDDRKKSLSGTSEIVRGDTYKIVIAVNGYNSPRCKVSSGKCSIKAIDEKNGLVEVAIDVQNNARVQWAVKFK